jgi:two-component system, sensor histidine kinase
MQRIGLHSFLLCLSVLLLPLLGVAALAGWLAIEVALAALVGAALAWGLCARHFWSELRRSRQATAAAQSALRAREAAWRSADRAKEDFVAMLGHELRNPLATLAAAAHVLRKVAPAGTAGQASAVVLRQIEHMSRLVEDLLDLSRLARGKMSLVRQPLDFVEAVRTTLRELRAAGRLEEHALELDLSPAWVNADEAHVRQIVANLVGNAVKYTPPGGTIVVSVRRDRNTVQLRVRDDGVGMAPELTARVFDLFAQGEPAGERAAGGLGIGLALVKRLAELHGGNVFAASSGPGEGSVFTVTLPAIEARQVEAPPPAAAHDEQEKHRILLIDANATARGALQAALELEGHRVYAAADASAGLQQAAAAAPDVAVIDIRLPDLSGYQVAEALRGRAPEGKHMVLVALTGYGQPDSPRRAQEAGFDQFVTKPIAPDRLLRLIDVACANRRN